MGMEISHMKKFTVNDILEATKGKLLKGSLEASVERVVIDSREALSSDLFVAIIGEVHDAHKFLAQVQENGCRNFLISHEEAGEKIKAGNVILVENTEKALGELARWYLNSLDLKKIAITGSMGKTSTRDMIYAMASTKYITGKPIKNYNSLIGISLTILSFTADTEVAVMELGMERLGEIHELVEIIRPHISVITYVSITHINTLGSRENIYKAKMEICDFLGKDNTLIINENCPALSKDKIKGDFQIVTVKANSNDECNYSVYDVKDYGDRGISFIVNHSHKEYHFDLDIPGAHNSVNCALALAAVGEIGISIEEASKGLATLERTGKRLDINEVNGIKIIDDTYSAFPEAVKSAIDTLSLTEGKRHIAILAGMNGLGKESKSLHKEIGNYARDKKLDLIIGVGIHTEDICHGASDGEDNIETLHLESKEELYPQLEGIIRKGDAVLVKGSRIFQMEDVVEKLKQL